MNIADFVEHHARFRGNKAAIEAGDGSLTYGDLNLAAQRIGGFLRSKQVKRGDVVGLLMTESPTHIAALIAVSRIGAIGLALDWRAAPAELVRSIERFSPAAVLTDRPRVPEAATIVLDVEEAATAAPDLAPPERLSNAPLSYGVSSGTTGMPKAMIITHEVQYARIMNIATEFPFFREDRFLAALPLAFAAGQIFVLTSLCLGATVIQLPPMFGAKEFVDVVRARKVSVVHLPPNMTRKLLALGSPKGERLMPTLRLFVSGTDGLSAGERAEVRERIAPNMLALYGCAGGGPVATLHDHDDLVAPDSVGVPLPSISIDIVDESGSPVPAGEVGWIRLQGAAIVSEIRGGDQNSEEGIHNGWYYPGDIGRIDTRGYLYLLGRSTELIKRGGKTIYSQEVEYALLSHPSVSEAAVIGLPSGDIGEDVVAFVILSQPIDPTELALHCRSRLSSFKVPSRIVACESFPRNLSGKVLKAELKRMA